MRKFTVLVSIVVMSFTFVAGFLETLKITADQAHMAIWDSFSYGNYAGPTSPEYHNFSKTVQLAMIKEIGAFAKAYSQTDDFKKRYAEHREGKKPVAPEPYQSTADMRKKMHESLANNIKDIEGKLSTYTGDTRKAVEQALVMLKQQLKENDDPKNPMYSAEMEATIKKAYDDRVKDYQREVAEWQAQNPESPHNLIKQRLTEFLQLSSTVDFSAKLQKGSDNKMVFVNPEYESKDENWKYIYRAGKEATDAARAIATQWLAEIK